MTKTQWGQIDYQDLQGLDSQFAGIKLRGFNFTFQQ